MFFSKRVAGERAHVCKHGCAINLHWMGRSLTQRDAAQSVVSAQKAQALMALAKLKLSSGKDRRITSPAESAVP